PHAPTVAAAVALDTDQQRRRTVTEGLVSQSARHGPARDALGATDPTPWIRLSDPALDHRPIRLDPLPDSDEPELVQAAEQREVRVSEGSVMHVEVFQMGCVGTPIIGGPRRLPGPDPLHPRSRRAPNQSAATTHGPALTDQASNASDAATARARLASACRLPEPPPHRVVERAVARPDDVPVRAEQQRLGVDLLGGV